MRSWARCLAGHTHARPAAGPQCLSLWALLWDFHLASASVNFCLICWIVAIGSSWRVQRTLTVYGRKKKASLVKPISVHSSQVHLSKLSSLYIFTSISSGAVKMRKSNPTCWGKKKKIKKNDSMFSIFPTSDC